MDMREAGHGFTSRLAVWMVNVDVHRPVQGADQHGLVRS